MSSRLPINLLPISSQLTSRLDAKGVVFLIKTEDQYFDDFYLRLLEKEKLCGSAQLLKYPLDSQQLNLNPSETKLVEIPSVTPEVMEYLANKFFQAGIKSAERVIYVLPKHFTNTSLDFPYKESFFSSSVFLSEQVGDAAHPALEEGLEQIFEGDLSPSLTSFYTEKWLQNRGSIGKLLFYARTFKKDVQKLLKDEKDSTNESYSFASFLDNKGAEFVVAAGVVSSVDTIQAFFRSFIYIEGSDSHSIELGLVELLTLSKIPKEELETLLKLATSPTFQLLSERNQVYRFTIPDYFTEWKELNTWISNEQIAFKQLKVFEEIAQEYFQGTGFLLGKDRLEQALILKKEIFTTYAWEEKYKVDKEQISSFLLLSQNRQEEQVKTQQKKRASLLRNSIRISIAVSIAFLLSSFTALLAYLERNSAVIQQELAIQSKEEADQARIVAENERLEAVQARENEQSALLVAEEERVLALDAKGQAEVQRMMAVDALILAKKSEQEASSAKEVAQKNEKLANEATVTAQINFETSEKLRNQQEARASALEALRYFANDRYATGIELVKTAYQKNLSNGGFPLQSDIFNALLNGMQASKSKEFEVDLDFPAKLLALSSANDLLAVYTINGEIRLYSTLPKLELKSVIKTGYIKSYEFLSSTEILGSDINNKLFLIDLRTNTISDLSTKLPIEKIKGFFKVLGPNKLWIAKLLDGRTEIFDYSDKNGFFAVLGDPSKLPMTTYASPIYWIEGNELYRSTLAKAQPELVVKATSSINSASWSTTHARWMLGLENGQIWSVDPTKARSDETFAIHATKVSQLVTMPYAHGTELMLSTGFDGGLTIFVLDKKIPLSASVSSSIKFQGHRSWITGFCVDENKKLAYSISNDRTIKVWPLEINQLLTN